MRPLDIAGQKFGRLTVIEEVKGLCVGKTMWKCACDCGNIVVVCGSNLTNSNTRSCGCLHAELSSTANIKHGEKNTRLYKIWSSMKARCNNASNNAYRHYGGRGIQVCSEWNKYEQFRDWAISHGYNDNLTIDRIDVDGNYCPENCRWATRSEQANNTTRNRYIEYNGEVLTVSEWARKLGVSYNALRTRILRNWSVERAFNTPYRKSSRNVESKA